MKNEPLHRIHKVSKRLEFLHDRLSDFFKIDPAVIKISEPVFKQNNFSINITIKIKKHADQNTRGYKLSNYNFELQGKYTEPVVFLYNGKFYNYDQLNQLFEILLSEMEDL